MKKMEMLRFIAEQKVVTVEQISRKFVIKEEITRIMLYQFKLSRTKFGDIKHGVWRIGEKEIMERIQIYYPQMPLFKQIQGYFRVL